MEKVFNALRCPDEDRVTFATFMLLEEADIWWNVKREKMGQNAASLTWEGFKELFRDKYIPQSVENERERAEKFESELRARIRQQVSTFELSSYKDVVNKAVVVERGLNDTQEERERIWKKRNRQAELQNKHGRNTESKPKKQTTVNDKTQHKDTGHRADTCPNRREQQT
ncbi:uncharacterized protein LOC120111699 [Phoenix dactylifera]|uniref:Uncharacterized protein LOC120111699 n=1 Tax=Phoenix dactylifera TaxID=42345 RepID=A0A8B9AI67_PHODC|nr:uncharacterized protein LOC120111699 [Phoenix dactylifera]